MVLRRIPCSSTEQGIFFRKQGNLTGIHWMGGGVAKTQARRHAQCPKFSRDGRCWRCESDMDEVSVAIGVKLILVYNDSPMFGKPFPTAFSDSFSDSLRAD
jgi:hypothetical protein